MDKMLAKCLRCKYGSRNNGLIVCSAPHIVKAANDLGLAKEYVNVNDLNFGKCPDFTPAS